MLTAESDSHVQLGRKSSQRDEEMGSPRTGKTSGQTEHVHWDFDAPQYWDLDNPETGGGFDDTWFGKLVNAQSRVPNVTF